MSKNSKAWCIAIAATLTGVIAVLVGCAPPVSLSPPLPENVSWETLALWPGAPPKGIVVNEEETRALEDQGWRKIVVLKNVSRPTLTLIRPSLGAANGAAMIVLPGGAFGALAWDVEGTEVGQFLASRGITAFVLKYRVRTPDATMLKSVVSLGLGGAMEPGRAAAAADAIQAVRYIRSHAQDFGIHPSKIGMIGFSAGAITTLRVLQDADEKDRPNIAASIYGFLFDKNVRPGTTPMFIAVANDDVVEPSRTIEELWRQAGAPSELHVFSSGGHGFGLGRPGTTSMEFPSRLEKWLRKQQYITSVSLQN